MLIFKFIIKHKCRGLRYSHSLNKEKKHIKPNKTQPSEYGIQTKEH